MGHLTLNAKQLPWQVVVEEKRKKRDASIELHIGIPEQHEDITSESDVATLAKRIAEGQLTAYNVTLAYVQRAAAAHQKTNCLTEVMFDDALRRAKELDEHFTTHGKIIGPLHGVPMTLKDQFDVQGYDTTLGYVGRAHSPASRNALLVDILQNAGAIILAKTNLPQSIMWCETENPLWGLTTNPHDPQLTPGGSTGGESALLAQHGSLVGWGTDIGGSCRIPGHMVGIYGLKPSSGRLPYQGAQVSTAGQEHVPSVVGPLARSLESIELVTREVIQSQPWRHDPTCHRSAWDEAAYSDTLRKPLVIGLLVDDGHVKVHPPLRRVLLEAVEKLKAAGHIVIPWNANGHSQCIEIMDLYYTADGGEDLKRAVAEGGEPFIPHVEALINRAPAVSVYEYWQLNRRKRAAQEAYLDKWHNTRDPGSGRKVDVLLTPTMPHPAVKHRSCKWVGYTKVWNLLDYPAIVLPFGKVDKGVDISKTDDEVSDYKPRNVLDEWNWSLYDPEAMDGLPLSVQIVGRRLEEEKVLAAGKVINNILRS